MATRFFTNSANDSLLSKIEGIFQYRNIHFFDALVGYFYASGYFRIRPFIEKAAQIRILVGINIDKLVLNAHQTGLIFDGSEEISQEEFFKHTKKNIQQADYNQHVEDGMLKLIEDIYTQKVIIKIHPKQNLHAKIYIFREELHHSHGYGAVITGSSNLTESGISRNFEFNVELRDDSDIKFATETFEQLWAEAVPIQADFAAKIQHETYLNNQLSPQEIYWKFLIEYFGKRVDFDPSVASDLPTGFKQLSYQIDAVNEGYSKMVKFNGFFLADVVGLGKTIIATLIARKYFYKNGFPTYRSWTLIIVPPALKDNWLDTIEKFRLDNVFVETNGRLHTINNPEKYDLVIIDEAHKFRSDATEIYNNLQKICKSTTRRQLEDGSFMKKRVILISATPLNNKPADIANLVYLFQDSKNALVGMGNLQHFFRIHTDEYNKAMKEPVPHIAQGLVKKIYEDIRNKVIKPLTVRRTRTDLIESESYSKDLKTQGIQFPCVRKPEKIFYQLDKTLEDLYDKTIQILHKSREGLTYNRYRAISALKPYKKQKYPKADLISSQLAAIMKTLLVKRIDSSFFAFKQSLNRFKAATDAMVKMFKQGRIYIAPNLPVSDYINEGKEDELLELVLSKMQSDNSVDIYAPDDFEFDFFIGLEKDLMLLTELVNAWDNIDYDPKLDVFISYINTKLVDKYSNSEQKLVVFSESKETTNYLKEALQQKITQRILTVDSSTRKERMPQVRANFDANQPLTNQLNDFDIIISTEVLAEGINLHRANIIINYDTPWNSTRLMQRIGRVNRIGSTAREVYIYNFFPTAQVNNDIELEKRAIMKLQAFHTALGEDSQIYSPDEETQSFGIFDQNLEDDRDEELKYLEKLRKYKEDYPDEYRRIKHLPTRVRIGRKSKTLTGGTVGFLRDAKREAFVYVKPNDEIVELSFIEAAKEIEAKPTERGIQLHDNHHTQVQQMLGYFSKVQDQENNQLKRTDITQGPNEKKAQIFLDAFINSGLVAAESDKLLILHAKDAIRKGKFQNLQRKINNLKKEQDKRSKTNTAYKATELLEKLLNILGEYPFSTEQQNTQLPQESLVQPAIVITESFSF